MAETKDELPVAGYINKFRNGDEEICFVDLRKYSDGPMPCEVEPLTSHAAAQSRINALLEEVKAAEAAKLRVWLDLIATGNHWKVEDEMRAILQGYAAFLSAGRSGSGDGGMG